jgi:DHA1 family bicyclomycin/chloramphenicol resistance-like MFS transporter
MQSLAQAEAVAPPRTGLRVLVLLSTLLGFASISTDLYLPALPTMAAALHADAGTVALTIAGYLVGFSVGQLLWGPIGDRYGRRGPIAIGLVLLVIGSAGCALSPTADLMIAWRVVQAVGACAGVVLARAMVRDLYAGNRAVQVLSTLMTIMAVAPLAGPIVGGQILALAGWRAIFWTLVGVGVLTLAALFTVPETLPPARRNNETLGRAFAGYGGLLRHRGLIGYAGAIGFLYVGLFANIAGSPFAYITYYQVSPQFYGVLFASGVIGIMATNMVNARMVARFGSDRLLRAGTVMAALSGVAVAVATRTGWGGLVGAGRGAVRVRIVGRVDCGERDRRGACVFAAAGGRGLGAGWGCPIRGRDGRLRAGGRVRGWDALADGVGDRGGWGWVCGLWVGGFGPPTRRWNQMMSRPPQRPQKR